MAFYQVRDGRAAEGQHFGKLGFSLRKLFYLSIFCLICNQSVSFIVVSSDPKLTLKKDSKKSGCAKKESLIGKDLKKFL